jgi:hypothetical protein
MGKKGMPCDKFGWVPNLCPRFKKSPKNKIKKGGLIWTLIPRLPEVKFQINTTKS